ncbi:MAG TPA: hypothetical protein VGP01_05915 [Rhizomicrobium sp.]|jgi:hypothetical protein|nr:hypothetical protein [Rhizomicrobium sp.]
MKFLTFVAVLCLASPAIAQTALKPALAPLSFLVGNWKSDDGKVADTGGTSKGGSLVSVQSDGWALLRQDHTELFGKDGKPAGGFHQTMVIYPDNGAIHADYVDGEGHAIHYVSAEITAGKSVSFSSVPGRGPLFHLSYELQAPGVLTVRFGMTPPGQTEFRPIASGTLRKAE